MARSEIIYVVLDPARPPQAFTVKHELITWLGRVDDPSCMRIWRVQDGIHKMRPPKFLRLQDLGLEEEGPAETGTRVRLFTWDWRDPAPVNKIGQAVAEFSADGRVWVREYRTGSDSFACIVSDHEVGDAEAEIIYDS